MASLDSARIVQALPGAVLARLSRLEVVAAVASTNDILHDPEPGTGDRVQLAEIQTAGRGRQGRSWQTPTDGLCFSMLHRYCVLPTALSLWAGCTLAEQLVRDGWGEPQLRWPNDLMYASAKFAGILTECRGGKPQPLCVIGVGINVGKVPDVDQPVTSLEAHCGRLADRNRLAASLIAAVSDLFQRLDASKGLGIEAYFDRYDSLRDKEVQVQGVKVNYTGTAQGVDRQGRLQVNGAEGLRTFEAGDVRVLHR